MNKAKAKKRFTEAFGFEITNGQVKAVRQQLRRVKKGKHCALGVMMQQALNAKKSKSKKAKKGNRWYKLLMARFTALQTKLADVERQLVEQTAKNYLEIMERVEGSEDELARLSTTLSETETVVYRTENEAGKAYRLADLLLQAIKADAQGHIFFNDDKSDFLTPSDVIRREPDLKGYRTMTPDSARTLLESRSAHATKGIQKTLDDLNRARPVQTPKKKNHDEDAGRE